MSNNPFKPLSEEAVSSLTSTQYSLLSYTELRALQETGVIRNSLPEHVNSTSIDVTLGSKILVEDSEGSVLSLRDRTPLHVREYMASATAPFMATPDIFFLAQSEQVFYLPDNISAEYKLKSSLARIGLEHMNAGWCDAGWNGSVLTLEFKNLTRYHSILLRPGDRIGQVVFFRHVTVPASASYASRGRYNGDLTPMGVKK